MTDSNHSEPINIGLDDGYAYTKLALPDGRLVAIYDLGEIESVSGYVRDKLENPA